MKKLFNIVVRITILGIVIALFRQAIIDRNVVMLALGLVTVYVILLFPSEGD